MILAQDEARFGRITQPRRCWAPYPERPVVPRQIVQEAIYVYAAVCPDKGRLTSLILPFANTEMMNLFLEQVSEDYADSFVVMLTDRASWHSSATLKVPENIRLIHQPPYSPELNPTEHIWEDIREKDFPNTASDSLDEVIDTLTDGINRLAVQPEQLRSMTLFPYLNLTL